MPEWPLPDTVDTVNCRSVLVDAFGDVPTDVLPEPYDVMQRWHFHRFHPIRRHELTPEHRRLIGPATAFCLDCGYLA